ncbi:MAG: hypothetical protein M3425_05330 [Actinomycetota bacterium]|nr:hypothetical protein [Actinomycetota bacterium]
MVLLAYVPVATASLLLNLELVATVALARDRVSANISVSDWVLAAGRVAGAVACSCFNPASV